MDIQKKSIVWRWFRWGVGLLAYILLLPLVLWTFVLVNQANNEAFGKNALVLLAESVILVCIAVGLGWYAYQDYRAVHRHRQAWQGGKVAVAIACAISMLFMAQLYEWIQQTIIGQPDHIPENQQMLMMIMMKSPVLLVVFAGLIAPVLEEFWFRGLLFDLLGRWFKLPICVVLSALLFAIPHAPSFDWDFVVYALLGIILGLCYWRTGQLRYSILAHLMNNGISLCLMWYGIQYAS